MSAEQLNGYKELKNYRNGKVFYDKKRAILLKTLRITCILISIAISLICFTTSKVIINKSLSSNVIGLTVLLSAYALPIIPLRFCSKLKKKTNEKYFKKKYPFVNMKIGDEKLERVLAFNDENNIKKIINNSINNKKNNSLSTSEKIRRLKMEKRVLENKYSNNSKPKTLKK